MTNYRRCRYCGHKKSEHWFGFSYWAKKHNKKVGIDKRFKNRIKKDLCSCQTCHEDCCRLKPNSSLCNDYKEQKYKVVHDKYGRICLKVLK